MVALNPRFATLTSLNSRELLEFPVKLLTRPMNIASCCTTSVEA
jgi:hypothetical protein